MMDIGFSILKFQQIILEMRVRKHDPLLTKIRVTVEYDVDHALQRTLHSSI